MPGMSSGPGARVSRRAGSPERKGPFSLRWANRACGARRSPKSWTPCSTFRHEPTDAAGRLAHSARGRAGTSPVLGERRTARIADLAGRSARRPARRAPAAEPIAAPLAEAGRPAVQVAAGPAASRRPPRRFIAARLGAGKRGVERWATITCCMSSSSCRSCRCAHWHTTRSRSSFPVPGDRARVPASAFRRSRRARNARDITVPIGRSHL
jgi:hypothetical protein